MHFTTESREVLVATGRYKPQPSGVFVKFVRGNMGYGGKGTVSQALDALARILGCPIVNETENTDQLFIFTLDGTPSDPREVDEALRQVSAQTSIQFSREYRPVRVLVLSST